MEKERFDSLMKNKTIQYGYFFSGFNFKSESNKVLIHISFKHNGHFTNGIDLIGERLLLFVYESKDFPFKNLISNYKKVKNESLILVNAQEPKHALTYKLIIDENDKDVTIKIEDMPEMGTSIISEKEKKGITVNY